MQFRPVVSANKKKLHSKTCGYLLFIRSEPHTEVFNRDSRDVVGMSVVS